MRNVVFISGRVHPGETPASHVVHGLLDFLLSSDPRAAVLRKLATWVIVPMLNPDGVSAGNYRCDAGADQTSLRISCSVASRYLVQPSFKEHCYSGCASN